MAKARAHCRRLVAAAALAWIVADPAVAEESARATICRLIDAAATTHAIPKSFFTRLIWRESSFRTKVSSGGGAQGIAQFMPGTAKERGLTDPFDPEQAIPASARLLSDLEGRFGSLGLAAAAYNAGPARVAKWVVGSSELPRETRRYVVFVTGSSADDWRSGLAQAEAVLSSATETDCLTTLASIAAGPIPADGGESVLQAAIAPWGIQLAGGFTKSDVLEKFSRMQARHARVLGDHLPTVISTRLGGRGRRHFYRIRIAFDTKASAQTLCGRLRADGGECLLVRN